MDVSPLIPTVRVLLARQRAAERMVSNDLHAVYCAAQFFHPTAHFDGFFGVSASWAGGGLQSNGEDTLRKLPEVTKVKINAALKTASATIVPKKFDKLKARDAARSGFPRNSNRWSNLANQIESELGIVYTNPRRKRGTAFCAL